MNILNKIFKGKFEKKSYENNFISSFCSSDYHSYKKYKKISNREAIDYYMIISSVNHAINLIADEFQSIEPLIWDKEKKEFTDKVGQDVLNLLNKPNKDITLNEFNQQLAVFYKATGNVYIVATGEINRPPLELVIIPSQDVTIEESNYSRYVERYTINTAQAPMIFEKEEIGGNIIYVDSSGGRQLWHIKDINPSSYNIKEGMSALNSLYYEIEQFIESSIHNLSLLRRGARMGGIIFLEEKLTDIQIEAIKKEMSNYYSGSENAGRSMVFDSKGSFQSMSQTQQDMDYLKLRNHIIRAIYNCLKVPLALVQTEEMAQATYEQAKLSLYDNAVLPLTERLYTELTNFLFPRFGIDINKYCLWYNVIDILALSTRRNEEILRIQKSGVVTINEIRALYGLKPIENGNILYQPLNLVPIGSASEIANQKQIEERYIEILKKYKNIDGSRRYSDEDIVDMVKQNFE